MAEAVTLMRRRATNDSNRVIVDADCLPQTIAVLETRLEPLGIASTWSTSEQGARRRLLRHGAAVPGVLRAVRDFGVLTERRTSGAPWSPWPRTSSL